MLWLNTAKSVLSILQSEDSPNQIAVAAALGCLIGFAPVSSPQAVLFFLVVMFFNVNVGMATIATAVFTCLAFLLDPLAHQIGLMLLVRSEALVPFWTRLYNTPVVPFTRFNNTVVLGSFVISVLGFFPVFFGTRGLIFYYRSHYKAKVDQWKIMKWLKATFMIDLAEKLKK